MLTNERLSVEVRLEIARRRAEPALKISLSRLGRNLGTKHLIFGAGISVFGCPQMSFSVVLTYSHFCYPEGHPCFFHFHFRKKEKKIKSFWVFIIFNILVPFIFISENRNENLIVCFVFLEDICIFFSILVSP